MTDRTYMSIGEVLALLQSEFPDVTISKIRFLESQGLIDPERTPSGYRKFYPADIERLRWILREQRENFLPLKVIKDRLDSGEPLGDSEPAVAVPTVASAESSLGIDAEEPVPSWLPKPPRPGPPAPPPARPAPNPGVAAPRPAGAGYTFDEILAESGLEAAQLKEVESYGLLAGRAVGRETYYDDDALGVAQLAAQFMQFGVEARHLRMYRTSAEREAGFVESVVMPLVKQRNPRAREQAIETVETLLKLGDSMRATMLRRALRDYSSP
jgi:DNA-binding transcriptional MerR regulator